MKGQNTKEESNKAIPSNWNMEVRSTGTSTYKPPQYSDLIAWEDGHGPSAPPYKDKFTGLKYHEDEFQRDLADYVESTYGQHYVGKNSVQVFDLIMANEDMEEYARWSAVKYLVRYGKKDGYNKKDLLKASHYIMLLHEATKEYKSNVNG